MHAVYSQQDCAKWEPPEVSSAVSASYSGSCKLIAILQPDGPGLLASDASPNIRHATCFGGNNSHN